MLFELRVKLNELRALTGATHGIRNFQKHKSSRETRRGDLPAEGDCFVMKLVVGIQRSKKEGRVGEDGLHRLGVP
jgi:hypothetical protein